MVSVNLNLLSHLYFCFRIYKHPIIQCFIELLCYANENSIRTNMIVPSFHSYHLQDLEGLLTCLKELHCCDLSNLCVYVLTAVFFTKICVYMNFPIASI